MSFYEFKTEDAERFASMYPGARRNGNEIRFQLCPYCHGGKKPDKGTFAINLKTGAFNCRRGSCGAKGNMLTLARDFEDFDIGTEPSRYYNIKDYNTQFRHFRDAHRITKSKDEAVEYLKTRGISEKVCRAYEITVADDNKKKLIFPFKTEDGELKFIKYRNIDPEAKGSKEWCEKNCMPILFGMNHCDGFLRLVVTEGQIDSLSLTEAGIQNAVSVPTGKNGFTWVPHCWDWMSKFQTIVVFGDCENGEITLARELSLRFKSKVKVVRAEDYQGCKDANDILRKFGKEALIKAVENAQYPTPSRIKDMSEVESIDIESLPAINSGVHELNKLLSGGFHDGDLVVLTGRRGEGKSTMASQFVVDALNGGNNCLIYSGEMKDYAVKNWLDRQVIGKGDRATYTHEREECRNWYKGRLFIYDDTEVDEEDTAKLLDTVEAAITQKNIRFVLIDNLMTAMEDTAGTNEALYRQQSNFVGKLAKLARRFGIVIMLICHPRKTTNQYLDNDDVSGTADITNKANIVMNYARSIVDGKEPDPAIRILSVTKNRLTGKTGNVRMYYFEDSKRVVEERTKDIKKIYLKKDHAAGVEEEEIPF